MTVSDIVQILTALGVILTAVVGILNRVRIQSANDKIDAVHETVNSTATAQTARVDQLGRALQGAGVDIPARPEDVPDPPTQDVSGERGPTP